MQANPGEVLLVTALVGAYIGVLCVPLIGIARKIGYSGGLAVLALIPGINLLLAWVLAVREWPVERELRELRSATSDTR